MRFHQSTAEVFVPDGMPAEQALSRTTHMAISAHQDDLEIMAAQPILHCYQQPDRWFTGVVLTDGRGSPRDGIYKDFTNDQMYELRIREQKKAAHIGDYAALALLDYPSKAVKDGADKTPTDDLVQLLTVARPEAVFTHNLADKHDTHVGTCLKTIEAIRLLPADQRPRVLYGCEVWRDLDWLRDEDKVPLDVSEHENLQHALLGVYDSQIAGGKRYDLATMGRRKANATYFASHGVDTATGLNFAMDLSPLINDTTIAPAGYVQGLIDLFAAEVRDRLKRLGA